MARLLDVDSALDAEQADARLATLRTACAAVGLNIVLPLAAAAFEDACATSAHGRDGRSQARSVPAGDLVLVGDGGPTFFARFSATLRAAHREVESAHPLDDFTRTQVEGIVARVFGGSGISSKLYFPFASPDVAPLPFQRLGQAAGLPPPGPLGLQIHPVFGPWWAYRALIATPLIFRRELALPASCAPCPGPCVSACVVHTARAASATLSGCGDECGGRDRCPVGAEHRYSDAQIAFHARARERLIAALASR